MDVKHDFMEPAIRQGKCSPHGLWIFLSHEFHATTRKFVERAAGLGVLEPLLFLQRKRVSWRIAVGPCVWRQWHRACHRNALQYASALKINVGGRSGHWGLDDPYVATGEREQAVVMSQLEDCWLLGLEISADHASIVGCDEPESGGQRFGA